MRIKIGIPEKYPEGMPSAKDRAYRTVKPFVGPATDNATIDYVQGIISTPGWHGINIPELIMDNNIVALNNYLSAQNGGRVCHYQAIGDALGIKFIIDWNDNMTLDELLKEFKAHNKTIPPFCIKKESFMPKGTPEPLPPMPPLYNPHLMNRPPDTPIEVLLDALDVAMDKALETSEYAALRSLAELAEALTIKHKV